MAGSLIAAHVAAQASAVSGAVLLARRSRVPLAGGWVVLHQIGMTGGRAVDSVRADASGRFRIRVAAVDTSAVYLLSAWRAGVAYFSSPLRLTPGGPTQSDTLVVYDTSSTGPPIAVRRRLITITKARDDGAREVLEILELANPGLATRVSEDTAHPTWSSALPAGVLQFQVGEGDFSVQAVLRRGDSVAVYGPVQPDAVRQLSFSYTIPASAAPFRIPVDQPIAELDLLLEDTTATLTTTAAARRAAETIEGRTFTRYTATALLAGATLDIVFPDGRFRPERLVPWIAGGMVVALAAGLALALRRPRAGADAA